MSLQVGQEMYRASIRTGSNYVSYEVYQVIKSTPKGAWIVSQWHYRGSMRDAAGLYTEVVPYDREDAVKWTPEDGKFCSTTKELAVARLKARTRSYVRHTRRRLIEAERRAAVLELPIKEPILLKTSSWFFERD